MSGRETQVSERNGATGVIALRIEPKEKSLGEFTVRRVLPATERQMVGPFIFFDHMGPAEFAPGQGIQVRPHPHIGLATITYLFEGEIMHRDNLGFVQPIQAGAVNLMTAGKGIVHSERAGSDLEVHSRLHGIQSWMALPVDQEDMAPDFKHYPATDLPDFDIDGVRIRVIIGDAYGYRSPVTAWSTMLYLECRLPKGSALTLPGSCEELGMYVVTGKIRIENGVYPGGVLAVANAGKAVKIEAVDQSRVMVIGGDHVGERIIWWNFVSSSRARLDQAKMDWREGRFGKVPGDDEFIPLPER
jgi:redox-sensitive bicupin YhaK (pirin superfamily)